MEKTEKEKEVIKTALKVLDQLKFQYGNSEEELGFMDAMYHDKEKMYDGKEWSYYTVDFFHNVFDIPKMYYCIVDAETMIMKGIGEDLGVQEVIYNKDGKATGTKFISPSFPYDKQ